MSIKHVTQKVWHRPKKHFRRQYFTTVMLLISLLVHQFMRSPFLQLTGTSTPSQPVNFLAQLWHNLHFYLRDLLQPYITKKCPRQKKMKTKCIGVEWEKQRGTQSFQGPLVWGRNNMSAWVNPTPTEEKLSVSTLLSIIVKHGAEQEGKVLDGRMDLGQKEWE